MQTQFVSTSFFWIMVVVAFAVGVWLSHWMSREKRRQTRNELDTATRLLAEVVVFARMANALPMALHRRVCDFRAQVRA